MGTREVKVLPLSAYTNHGNHAASTISPFLYLNRCIGGCMVNSNGGTEDARTQTSAIPAPGNYMIGEFTNAYGQLGTMGTCPDGQTVCTTATQDTDCGAGLICDTADVEWAQLVQCMKEVDSPFAITVTDQIPTGGVSYTEAIMAGQPGDIGEPVGVLGIAPLSADCSPQDNVISFSFSNHEGKQDHVYNACWTAAQESAHAFGLDHEYQFSDMTSACNDPMTYRTDCGGEKFYRNEPASCGEYAVRPCRCGGEQNSHLKILSVFGPGTSIVPAPTVSIVSPTGGAVNTGFPVFVTAGSKRGVASVQLWLNGYNWAQAPGAAFGQEGQTNPSQYSLTAPSNVPDGNIQMVIKAFDDLQVETDSPPIMLTKGAPCADATSCLPGQLCGTGDQAGECYWNPPTGQLGDACTYPQFCTSGLCQGTATQQICTESCIAGSVGACPTGYDCIPTSDNNGICFPTDNSSGCCSVGHEAGLGAFWVHGGLAALVLGFVVRRRRRR